MAIHPRLLSAFLLVSGVAHASPDGTWTTDFGPMRLQLDAGVLTGDYGDDDGRLTGRLNGNVFQGYWTERRSDRPCATPGPGGSLHWGRIELTFDSDRFSGRWSYCDEPVGSGGNWDGTRTASAAPAPAPAAGPSAPGRSRWVLDGVRVETPEAYLADGPCRLLTADTRDDGMRLHYRCTDQTSNEVTEYAANFDYQIQLPALMTPDSVVSAQGRLVAQAGDFSASCSLGPAVLVPALAASAAAGGSDQGGGEAGVNAPWCDESGNCPTLELSCAVSSTQELRRTWVYRWQP